MQDAACLESCALCLFVLCAHENVTIIASRVQARFVCTEQSGDEKRVDMAVAAAQHAAALRAAESRAQAAMMVEAVEDRAYEVRTCL